ncbi:MAG: RIP metalloprotease RseP [Bacillota bacterium]|nr:RIP metalloprotease RseP [Bacillota bacterium]
MSTFTTIIAAVLVFCFMVLVHEFGHFIVAKACRVYVEDFSIGMGPRLLHWQGKETEYCLRLLPLGGWCKMRGEDEDSEDERAFCRRPVWQRICIVAAGPIMNFLSAFLIYVVIYMILGIAVPSNLVGEVSPDSPAALAGMEAGDRLLSINGQEIQNWADIDPAMDLEEAGSIEVWVQRDGEELQFLLTPEYDAASSRWLMGIYSSLEESSLQKEGFFQSISLGLKQSISMLKLLASSIVGMIGGTVPVDISGPVGIVTVIGQAANDSLRSVLSLLAFLSLNLGFMNLIPLPALDGSRIIFLAIEGIRGKAINREIEGIVHFVGLILLMGLMLLITYQDIVRLVTG